MNAIVAVVLLAACVSAQTFDRPTVNNFNTEIYKLLLKSGHHQNTYNNQWTLADLLRRGQQVDTIYPTATSSVYNNYNGRVDTSIYTLDEIIRHPLFQQYLTLPLFRQHITHPLFQYYLTTPLFQHYWTIPQFQTFFQNPYLFYKYVYPMVYNTQSTMFDQVNVDVPFYPTTNVDSSSMVDVNRYLNKDVLPVDSLYNINKYNNRYPLLSTMYGQQSRHHQYPSIFTRNHLPYTYVMDKIFKSYFVNKPTITEVVTDVKVLPNNKIDQQTLGKYVDPITGEIKYTTEDFKTFDDKIVPQVSDDLFIRKPTSTNILDQLFRNQHQYEYPTMNKYNTFEGQHINVKDGMLKRMLLNKVMYGDRKIDEIFPEYVGSEMKNIPILEKIEKLNKLNRLENIVGQYETETYPKTSTMTDFDEMIRTPVVASDLLRRSFNKDLLTRVPLTKDLKDFTFATQDKIYGDKMMPKYEIPTEFKTYLDKPITV